MEIQLKDLSYEVYKRLKAMILAGEFKEGEKLKQEHIAQLFGVSRMPLHKAFQMLENEMLVENFPRRGFYVTKIDHNQLVDAFELREVLEGVAARRAAARISADEINYLKSLFEPFKNAKNIDEKKYVEADQEFHNSILKFSGNQLLKRFDIIGNITFRTYRGGLIRTPEETIAEHQAVIEALEARNGALAEKRIRAHSHKSSKILLKKIQKQLK